MSKRRVWLSLAVAGLMAATLLPVPGASAETATCEWLAGDLHVHTTYSHDSYGGPDDDNTDQEDFYTFGWGVGDEGKLAADRGLDYVAITDHNDVRAQQEFDEIAQHGVVPVPSYENSFAAHVQMHGATRLYDNGQNTLADVERVAEELRADGGLFQANHPSDGNWVAKYGTRFVPDAIEIWNIGVWAYEPPMPATNDHEYPLRFYDDYLSRGHRVTATGGSDSHWRATTAVQGVGQPTTWICAASPDARGLLDGMKAGRTTISDQPPAYGDTFAELRADGDGDGVFESMLGDTVTPGSPIQVSVTGAPGAMLRVVTNVGSHETSITSTQFTHEFEPPNEAIFVRAEVFYEDAQDLRSEQQEICAALQPLFGFFPPTTDGVAYCESRLAVVALTSPIYMEQPQLDRSTTLVYDGDTSARAGDVATFAATLTGANGAIADAPVEFVFRGTTYRATTDPTGRAAASVKVLGPPGTYEVVSSFAGDDNHDASGDADPFEVTTGR